MRMKMKKQSKYRLKCYTDDLEDVLEHLLEEVYLAQHVMYVDYNDILIVAYPGDSVDSLYEQYHTKVSNLVYSHK